LRVQYWNVKLKSERQRTDASKRVNDIKSKMSIESIKIIENNNQHLRVTLKDSLKGEGKLCKENTKDRREYLQQMVEDIKERDTLSNITLRQFK
jgi:hypothetical protein